MERHGIRIDVDYLDKAIVKVEKQLAVKEAKFKETDFYDKWRQHFGAEANLASANQLGTLLGSLNVKIGEKTLTLRTKVDEANLRRLDMDFVQPYLEIKKLWKTLNTYLRGIRREVDEKGYLHPFYNLASGDDKAGGAESYRGSSSCPNFQNIPIRNKVMQALIRPCFTARKGCYLVERDFSGIEVRVAACYTKDRRLIKYIKDPKGGNMHHDMAKKLFGLRDDQVIKEETRDCAKNMFTFPQFYGSVYFQCAPNIWEAMEKRKFVVGGTNTGIREHLRKQGVLRLGEEKEWDDPPPDTFLYRVKQVQDFMWNETFVEYTQWKKDWYRAYCERGWFPLYTGFVCSGYYRRNQVLNFSIQGSAFHCLLKSIILIDGELQRRRMRTRLVGQIHDSLLADVPKDEIQEYLDLSQEVMSERLPEIWKWICVPIDTEVDVCPIGGSWFDKQGWEKIDGRWRPANMKKWREACLKA